MPLTWTCEGFEQLGAVRLYALLRLRSEVFVVEQNCAFLDLDGLDEGALHLAAWRGAEPVAYARLLAPGVKAPTPTISRVITAPSARGTGLGHELNAQALAACERLWPQRSLTLFAQAHLQGFYSRAGFVGVGEEFMEDGIPHREMQKEAKQ